MTSDTLRTPAALRRTARRIALAHRLAPDDRARLVLSVGQVADPVLAAGHPVTLTSRHEASPHGNGSLTLTLRLPTRDAVTTPATARLPLPGRQTTDGAVYWHLATPPAPPAPAPHHGPLPPPHGRPARTAPEDATDLALAEEELRAVLAKADNLTAEHRKLKHELAETNSGVLALYVQLDERDEEQRRSHGRTLRALEDALRPKPLDVEGLELAVHYAPASTDDPTGGDLYDWFVLPDGTVHITIVDALGHGIASTRTALNVTHTVRTLALEGHPLDTIVARTDQILAPLDHSVMATVLLTRFDPATGEVHLANGSHPPALLVRADGTATYLMARGRGIGFPLPGSDSVVTAALARDDLIVLYTDGLTESRRDPFEGERRLLLAAGRHRGRPTAEIPAAIAGEVLTDVLHKDDTLAIAVRFPARPPGRRPEPGGPSPLTP
ncbi:PP2C family protein-serine/threonine phosphatase [Streptomyces sp. NPDC012888]|uniref:PP2C family protein-serine/threonine phosphatase n=1 Tax=Streptomyces sp. NPDC012888 TaxID=3364855 RepID=UPI0036A54FA3